VVKKFFLFLFVASFVLSPPPSQPQLLHDSYSTISRDKDIATSIIRYFFSFFIFFLPNEIPVSSRLFSYPHYSHYRTPSATHHHQELLFLVFFLWVLFILSFCENIPLSSPLFLLSQLTTTNHTWSYPSPHFTTRPHAGNFFILFHFEFYFFHFFIFFCQTRSPLISPLFFLFFIFSAQNSLLRRMEGNPPVEAMRLFLDGTADLMRALKSPKGIKLVLEYKESVHTLAYHYKTLVSYFTTLMDGLPGMQEPREAIPILLHAIDKIEGVMAKQVELVQSIQMELVELSEGKVCSFFFFLPFHLSFPQCHLLGCGDPRWH